MLRATLLTHTIRLWLGIFIVFIEPGCQILSSLYILYFWFLDKSVGLIYEEFNKVLLTNLTQMVSKWVQSLVVD